MTTSVRTLTPDRPVSEAVAAFQEFGFRHLPVVTSEGVLVGMVSDRDALRVRHKDGENTTVADIMTTGCITARLALSITEAIELVVFHRISALPVVTPAGALCGVVTTTDLLQALHEVLQERRHSAE